MSEVSPVILDASPGGVAVVMLNRPEKHNAFNTEIIEQLSDAFETLRAADHVRVVFVRGSGKSFSAGADLTWMRAAADYTHDENAADALKLAEMLERLHSLPQMTVALVNGVAMGGGAGLVAACDIAVAVKSAQFRFSEVRLGLTPATISPYIIEAIGARRAKALFVSGEGFDAAYAEKIGLIQYVVEDPEGLDAMMSELADLAFHTAPGAVADAKKLVRDVAGEPITHALLADTAKRIADRRASEEGREGLAAFLDKRRPSWSPER
ncbi:MAG: enoyl-CoA hydratase-related protein [Maricaulaceae bacterium]